MHGDIQLGLGRGHHRPRIVTVTIGDDEFYVETDGDRPNSSDAVKRFVDARTSSCRR